MNFLEKHKKKLLNISVLMVTLLAFLLCAEIFLRIFFAENIVLFPRYHTDANYGEFTIRKLKPNSKFWHSSIDGSWEFVTNKQGFRSKKDFSYQKKADSIRVLALGDSFTQGFEVRQEHTYSSILGKYLKSKGLEAEVINTGVSGFSTAEELIFMENEGFKYSPDYVLVGFYANDYDDNLKSDIFRMDEGKLLLNKKKHIPGVKILNFHNSFGGFRWLSENSYFYSFFLNLVWKSFKAALLKQKSMEMAVFSGSLDTYKIDMANALIQRLCSFNKAKKIKTIFIDIPHQFPEGAEYSKSSIVPKIKKTITENCDGLLLSKSYLGDFNSIVDPFVPHGQRHLSEFSHSLIGLNAGKIVEDFELNAKGSLK